MVSRVAGDADPCAVGGCGGPGTENPLGVGREGGFDRKKSSVFGNRTGIIRCKTKGSRIFIHSLWSVVFRKFSSDKLKGDIYLYGYLF